MQNEDIKEVSAEMQKKQFEIDSDMPFSVNLGRRTYKVTYLKEWVGRRFSYEIAKKNSLLESESENYNQLKALDEVGSLPSKCLSIAILNNWFKIKLFHWAFWRYISIKYTQSEINKAISDIADALELEVFFYNIASLENLNQLRVKMTQVEALQYRQEQVSAQKPIS